MVQRYHASGKNFCVFTFDLQSASSSALVASTDFFISS